MIDKDRGHAVKNQFLIIPLAQNLPGNLRSPSKLPGLNPQCLCPPCPGRPRDSLLPHLVVHPFPGHPCWLHLLWDQPLTQLPGQSTPWIPVMRISIPFLFPLLSAPQVTFSVTPNRGQGPQVLRMCRSPGREHLSSFLANLLGDPA